jgi:hypothetical protein
MESIVHDIDIYGLENPDGSPKEHFEQEAVKNALIAWLTSKKGEYLQNPEAGGILDTSVFKMLSNNQLDLLGFKIKNAIINNFVPAITLREINLIPDYERRMLEIKIFYSSPLSNKKEAVVLYLNAPKPELIWSYEEIEYIEENLRNFCLLKQPENKDKKLLYKADDGIWTYGKYKLINLTAEDSYFTEILEICNLTA